MVLAGGDRLYFSNFGYGGDPNDVSRLRVSKNKWYGIDALFRKDQNFWDYSLQANPLNPTLTFLNGPAGYGGAGTNACTACVLGVSPHLFNTRRKLGDYSLLLLPDSKIRFRAGYARNIVEGPGLSSIHEGTEQMLFENYKTTVNTYRLGVDFRFLPRTNISYDQIWNYYKGDTGITDPFQNPLFHLSNGTAVDLGWSFNAGRTSPAATPLEELLRVQEMSIRRVAPLSATRARKERVRTPPLNSSACNRITGRIWISRPASATPVVIPTYLVTTKHLMGAFPGPMYATMPLPAP